MILPKPATRNSAAIRTRPTRGTTELPETVEFIFFPLFIPGLPRECPRLRFAHLRGTALPRPRRPPRRRRPRLSGDRPEREEPASSACPASPPRRALPTF